MPLVSGFVADGNDPVEIFSVIGFVDGNPDGEPLMSCLVVVLHAQGFPEPSSGVTAVDMC